MADCDTSATSQVIRLSDKSGVIRGKVNRPFEDII